MSDATPNPPPAAENAGGESPEAVADLDPRVPPASFTTLLTMLASQAMVSLGQIPDPMQQKPIVRPRMARHFIDMIATLEEKTKGNLDKDEAQALENILYQLRMNYVSVSKK